jgi:hypothetical protein
MAGPKFKQKCAICKDNMVIMFSRRQFPICSDCHMKQIDKPINDPKFKKFFDIPIEFYEQNSFLRNIKQSYIRFENLSEKQIEAFKKTVEDMKNPKPKEEPTDKKTEEK